MKARRLNLVALALLAAAPLALPAAANAEATIGPPPTYSSASGLPDGRVYEEVSPANKHGYIAAYGGKPVGNASAGGDSVMYIGNGPMGELVGGGGDILSLNVATHMAGGWRTRGALPHPAPASGGNVEENATILAIPQWILPSSDFSALAFSSGTSMVPAPASPNAEEGLYLEGSDPLTVPAWIAGSQVAALPFTNVPAEAKLPVLVGGTPDLSTVYFAARPALLPQDAPRVARVDWGVYEYSGGVLTEAGVMSDGSVNSFGAAPSGFAEAMTTFNNPDRVGNQVAGEGSRLFFVSPEPYYSKYSSQCSVCSTEASELYVREGTSNATKRTVLVSRSQVLGHAGEPAPHGALAMRSAVPLAGPDVFSYASSDGSRVFFQSVDRLTDDAPQDELPKTYYFDLSTERLTYLPGVGDGALVVAAGDGSSFLYEDTSTSLPALKLWREGPNGGSITLIAQLPEPSNSCSNSEVRLVCVGPGRVSVDGSKYVFAASAPIPGFNDKSRVDPLSGISPEVFQYDLPQGELRCVSCPPAGVEPVVEPEQRGGTNVSSVDQILDRPGSTLGTDDGIPNRIVSSDGDRIFFDTPSPLVPQDVNGVRDVYEWEKGTIFLLSSGTSPDPSYVVDNSESGNDVFFGTTSELMQGDNDAGYDIYDARVPRPGDNPPPAAVPCQGDVCQGPPSVPQLLTAPASAVFSGIGNLPETATAPARAGKPKATKPKKKKKKKKHRAKRAPKAPKRGKAKKSNGRGGR